MHSLPILLAAALAAPAATPADNWTHYRGPRGDGRSAATGLPVHWGEKQNVRWKTAIHGKGWSSPVVWGEQVWLTTAPEDGKQLFAVCIDRRSGKILHDVKVFEVEKPAYCHPFNSYASPTPAIEEGRVYVHFGSAGTACLDTGTGKVLWTRQDLPCNHHRGPGSSPLLIGGLLFLHFDGLDQQYVVALDKKTGRTAWKKTRAIDYGTDNGDLKKAYATPTIITVDGKPQLISPAAVATIAYDPQTGEELWKVYHGGMNFAARPVHDRGLVFLTSGDGGLGLVAVRTDGRGDVTRSHVVWKQKKGVPNRSSLLLADGLLYMITEAGVVSCLEAQTGRQVWQGRLRGQFVASPLYADGKIYFFNREGGGYVIEAGRRWKLLATNKLDDGCMASPAAAGKSLFVRTLTHLYCLQRKD